MARVIIDNYRKAVLDAGIRRGRQCRQEQRFQLARQPIEIWLTLMEDAKRQAQQSA